MATATVQQLVDALATDHRGAARGISALRLAARLGVDTRHLRELIAEANMQGHAVGGHPRAGYYMAATPEEAQGLADHLIHRSKFGLLRASRILGKPLLELAGQLSLDTDPQKEEEATCQTA